MPKPIVKHKELKEKFLEYYSEMPIKKYAAYSIGRDEDTILLWEKEDSDFSDSIKQRKANYLLLKAKRLSPTFIVPLLFRELTPRQDITTNGEKLEPLQVIIIEDKSNAKP